MVKKEYASTQETVPYKTKNIVRFITAASLFDGHDAAINIIRRILQATGAEVIHLGHNRSVAEIVKAAIEEDVQGISVSSYQGGHMEFFKYMYDLLHEKGAGHIKIFGGGGGVIVPEEMEELHKYGITRIYSPEDGRLMGLQGIINDMLRKTDYPVIQVAPEAKVEELDVSNPLAIARMLTMVELDRVDDELKAKIKERIAEREKEHKIPVIGITGTGGAGKSSLVDEVIRRFLEIPDLKIAIISADPSKRKTGGALLGDRIRMNSIQTDRVYMRSMATRVSGGELPENIETALDVVKAAGFDFVILETSGIGQGDTAVVDVSDISIYVMTADYGAQSQLEKIDMIDYADFIVINKFDHPGAEDALRDVRKQYRRSRGLFDIEAVKDFELPIFGTISSAYNDKGVNAFYTRLRAKIAEVSGRKFEGESKYAEPIEVVSGERHPIIPPERIRYLSEIADTVRDYHKRIEKNAEIASKLQRLRAAKEELESGGDSAAAVALEKKIKELESKLDPEAKELLEQWPKLRDAYMQDEYTYYVRGKAITVNTKTESLARNKIPRIALPSYTDDGDLLRYLMKENLPGFFPYTAGVYPFRRTWEEPRRQFAGEGTPERTNKRFHYLTRDDEAKRLSTAFDSVTLYGQDPDERPDIFGKIGESGVSVCTLEDMKKLYAGFDLCSKSTSVSMTINGPAPIMLAFYMNTAFDQQVEKFKSREGREPNEREKEEIWEYVFKNVRGTVQADILKEDQAQNTCIFSTDFALRMMADIQDFFINHMVRNYYSVSISGYHIAEAGANPVTQLAFTLANGFTYVEYYLARGMKIDDFAPNFSFFFSNGLDPEYTVIGRVARRIWAVAMKYRYHASARSQMLKYHVQTSGRSLHAQEIQFNDIRTTLQALLAIFDNCNSLHTNAYDEAITTPTEESVRRAVAIQLIINRELGLNKNENPWQGSFIVDWLTDMVEREILAEFDRLSDRGGVLGAMEKQYQRSKIQEESLYYEMLKTNGKYPIIGVNTFLSKEMLEGDYKPPSVPLSRASYEEKMHQLNNLRAFQNEHADKAKEALARLQMVALTGGNIFAELLHTVRYASLGQISDALYEIGGQYRRNM